MFIITVSFKLYVMQFLCSKLNQNSENRVEKEKFVIQNLYFCLIDPRNRAFVSIKPTLFPKAF